MASNNKLVLAAAIFSFGFAAAPTFAQTTTTDTTVPVEADDDDDGDEGKWGLLGLLGLAGLAGLKRRDNHVHRDTTTTGRH
jgi:MYXO-CTERM domain-containing protein